MKNLNFFVLATGNTSKHLVSAIESRGHTYSKYDPNDLYLFVSDSINGYDRIYNGSQSLDNPTRIVSKNFNAIISRLGGGLEHGASILRHLNENLGIYCAQNADGLETASNKLKTTQKLSHYGLKVPATTYAKNPVHIDFLIKKLGGLPAIGKMIRGSQGNGVFIMETPQAANTALQSFYNLNASMKLQKFVEANSTDIRAIVIGNTVSVAMERKGKKDFRANISQGGSGKKITLSDSDTKLCVDAAKALGLEFAGVDLIKDGDGVSYIVEVNGNPGTKIIDITKHNFFEDLVKHIEGKVKPEKSSNKDKTASTSLNNIFADYNASESENKSAEEKEAEDSRAFIARLRTKYGKLMDGI